MHRELGVSASFELTAIATRALMQRAAAAQRAQGAAVVAAADAPAAALLHPFAPMEEMGGGAEALALQLAHELGELSSALRAARALVILSVRASVGQSAPAPEANAAGPMTSIQTQLGEKNASVSAEILGARVASAAAFANCANLGLHLGHSLAVELMLRRPPQGLVSQEPHIYLK